MFPREIDLILIFQASRKHAPRVFIGCDFIIPHSIKEGSHHVSYSKSVKELVALCQQGKNIEAIEKFYSPNIVSVEAMAMPGMDQTQIGLDAIKGKNTWWVDNHEVHGGEVMGPYPNGDRFIVLFKFDVTPKHTGKRMKMEEAGLYTVESGKIVKEEFYYLAGDCS